MFIEIAYATGYRQPATPSIKINGQREKIDDSFREELSDVASGIKNTSKKIIGGLGSMVEHAYQAFYNSPEALIDGTVKTGEISKKGIDGIGSAVESLYQTIYNSPKAFVEGVESAADISYRVIYESPGASINAAVKTVVTIPHIPELAYKGLKKVGLYIYHHPGRTVQHMSVTGAGILFYWYMHDNYYSNIDNNIQEGGLATLAGTSFGMGAHLITDMIGYFKKEAGILPDLISAASQSYGAWVDRAKITFNFKGLEFTIAQFLAMVFPISAAFSLQVVNGITWGPKNFLGIGATVGNARAPSREDRFPDVERGKVFGPISPLI